MDNAEVQEKLLARVRARRNEIKSYIDDIEPRGTRLSNVSIVCSAIATALTAGPALGGTTFTEGVQHMLGIADDSGVWRVLCLAATILSIATVISTNLYKSYDMSSRLAKAQASGALLSGLETLIEFGQLPVTDGARLYQQYIVDVAFIPEGQSGGKKQAVGRIQ